MNVSEQILRFLKDRGVTRVFGIVGRESDSIVFDECPGLEFVLTKHEFSAGLMAIGTSRFTGVPQVCFATLGPGTTNLATALATALLDRYPLIALVSQIETHDADRYSAHQVVDAVAFGRPLTKFVHEVRHASDVVPTLQRAYDVTMTEPCGPALIVLPNDVLKETVPCAAAAPAAPPARTGVRAARWEDALAAAAETLERARCPMLVVGDGAVKGGTVAAVQALAEARNIPVVTSYSAKGAIPPAHPLNYGAITPYMDALLEMQAMEATFAPADCLVLVGWDLTEHLLPSAWHHGGPKRLIRLASWHNSTREALQPDVDVVGPMSEALEALGRLTRTVKQPHGVDAVRERMALLQADRDAYPEGVLPTQVLGVLNEYYPDYLLANDVGLHRHASALFFRANRPLDFLTSAGLSSFGSGLPLAIAAKLANPTRPVVEIAGDVGFHSNSPDLETAVRLGLPITVLVLNNGKAGLIERYQRMGQAGRRNPAILDYTRLDFARIAEASGAQGLRINKVTELPSALDAAAEHRSGPTVIDVPVEYPRLYINAFSKNFHKR